MKVSTVFIIFNPKSTGKAATIAKRLAKKIEKKTELPVELLPTKHAGHGRDLAAKIVADNERPLIISVSGDGGYHEVINGVLNQEDWKSHKPVLAVEAAGNANDHYHAIRTGPLIDAILVGKTKKLQCLAVKVRSKTGEERYSLYAHSYWGIGLTSKAIDALNKKKLNPINEKVMVMKELVDHKAVVMSINGKNLAVSNVIAALVPRMAKLIKLHKDLIAPPPGKFRLVIDKQPTRAGVVRHMIKGVTAGLQSESTLRSRFSCTLRQDALMQLDGEVYKLSNGDVVTVSISENKLLTL